jgi:hypothetical protein
MSEVLNVLSQVLFTLSPGSTTLEDLGLPYEAPRSNSDKPKSVGLHWTSDCFVAKASTLKHTKISRDGHPPPPPVGFEPAIPPSERPKTHVLDHLATRIGAFTLCYLFNHPVGKSVCIGKWIHPRNQFSSKQTSLLQRSSVFISWCTVNTGLT